MSRVARHYHFGQLRLSRLNWLVRVLPTLFPKETRQLRRSSLLLGAILASRSVLREMGRTIAFRVRFSDSHSVLDRLLP